MKNTKQCPEFPHFGASYPDATCINQYLWDLDSVGDNGNLTKGGEVPCPFCNKEEYFEWMGDVFTREEKESHLESLQKIYNS